MGQIHERREQKNEIIGKRKENKHGNKYGIIKGSIGRRRWGSR